MIVNFYIAGKKEKAILVSKNLEIIPYKDTYIEYNNELYIVTKVTLNLNNCEYYVKIMRYYAV